MDRPGGAHRAAGLLERHGRSPRDIIKRIQTRVAIAIHNNGAIPGDVRASLFEPYHRQPNAEAQRSRSLGLGLFIAKEIVKAHLGTITLSSTPARGTTFTVVLARHPTPADGELR